MSSDSSREPRGSGHLIGYQGALAELPLPPAVRRPDDQQRGQRHRPHCPRLRHPRHPGRHADVTEHRPCSAGDSSGSDPAVRWCPRRSTGSRPSDRGHRHRPERLRHDDRRPLPHRDREHPPAGTSRGDNRLPQRTVVAGLRAASSPTSSRTSTCSRQTPSSVSRPMAGSSWAMPSGACSSSSSARGSRSPSIPSPSSWRACWSSPSATHRRHTCRGRACSATCRTAGRSSSPTAGSS